MPPSTLGLIGVFVMIAGCAGTLAVGDAIDGSKALEHVARIVGFGPHPAGSDAQIKVTAYIVDELERLGLPVVQDRFAASTPLGVKTMTNVWSIVEGSSDRVILLASHYDSKFYPTMEFVGANDGGSSTGLLLEMARVLSGDNPTGHTLWLVFFDGEEAFVEWTETDSLYGSRRFVDQVTASGEIGKIDAMILLDLVGSKDIVLDVDTNSTRWLIDLVWDKAHEMGFREQFPRRRWTAITDDHLPFARKGIDVLDIIDLTTYSELNRWHTRHDTLDKLSAESLAMIGNVVMASLPDISRRLRP